jgi:hypothetical protein
MDMSTAFPAQVLGQTEKALNAILDRELAGTISEPQWIALTLAVMGGERVDRDELATSITHGLKISDADPLIAGLVAVGFVEDGATVVVTHAGHRFFARIRARIAELTQRLWGDLPVDDLETAGRVLTTILGRANAELG